MWEILLEIGKPIKFKSGLPAIITRLSKYKNNNYIDNTTSLHNVVMCLLKNIKQYANGKQNLIMLIEIILYN